MVGDRVHHRSSTPARSSSSLVGLVAAAAPLATVAVTAFLVNVRHVFYALSFPLHRVHGRAGKTYSTFALTD